MIKSIICDILGIKYPLFQGGMAWIADANLAAAVSNAGGLGLISSINYGTEAVRNEIRKGTGNPLSCEDSYYINFIRDSYEMVI